MDTPETSKLWQHEFWVCPLIKICSFLPSKCMSRKEVVY